MNESISLNWDNWLIIYTDWLLSDFGEVLGMVKKMPPLDLIIKNYSQYTDIRYWTWCTLMWAINAFATINNIDFSWKDISDIYDVYEKQWRKPWNPWARWGWAKCMATYHNEMNPNNKLFYFVEDIFSEAVDIVLEKLWIIGISIRVDSKYRKDARDNLKIDWLDFLRSWGHATTMMKIKDSYICVDSVPKTDRISNDPAMIYEIGNLEKLRYFLKKTNIRADVHIFIMEERLRETDTKEKDRLENFKKNLEQAIEANSNLWNLTTQEEEKLERNRQNNYNRAKLKIIEAMLWL